jgi:molecular chaperone GrpE
MNQNSNNIEDDKEPLDQEESEERVDSFERSETSISSPEEINDQADLSKEYQKLRLELDEYKNLFLRKAAEFENFKKRKQSELQIFLRAAEESLILNLLPVLDDFDRLLASSEGDADSLRQGARLIRGKLWDVLASKGLEPLDALGTPFDPNLHHAIIEQHDKTAAPGMVLAEHEKGYKLAGKVIRPARVVVSA